MAKGPCKCERTIAPSVLEGYACGNAECWRTPVVKAEFEAFVAELVRKREQTQPAAPMPL